MINKNKEVNDSTTKITNELKKELSNSKELLAKMDDLIKTVSGSQPAFYTAYTTSRILPSTNSSKLAFKIKVLNAENDKPIYNAEIKIYTSTSLLKSKEENEESATPVLEKKTTKNGIAQQKNMNDDDYDYEIKCFGFDPYRGTYSIVKGQTTKLIVKMKKK